MVTLPFRLFYLKIWTKVRTLLLAHVFILIIFMSKLTVRARH